MARDETAGPEDHQQRWRLVPALEIGNSTDRVTAASLPSSHLEVKRRLSGLLDPAGGPIQHIQHRLAVLRDDRQRLADLESSGGARAAEVPDDLAVKEKALKEVLARLAIEEKESAQLQAALRLQEEKLNTFLDGLQKDETAQKQVQAELAEEAVQLERLLAGLLVKPKGEAFEAAVGFATLHGSLPQPVAGTLAQGFGEHLHPRFHTKTVQSGLLIAAGHQRRSMNNPRVPLGAKLRLAGACILWAASFIATKTALRSIPPLTVVTLRLVISALCFAGWLAWKRYGGATKPAAAPAE